MTPYNNLTAHNVGLLVLHIFTLTGEFTGSYELHYQQWNCMLLDTVRRHFWSQNV